MIRSELVQKLSAENRDLKITEIEEILDCVLNSVIDQLATGGRVELRGFGTFSTREREQREGRNPRTGQAVPVPAKRVAYFKAGKEMRLRLNG